MKKIIIMFLLVFGIFTFFTSNAKASDCTPTTKSSIKVLSPNGGEVYSPGQQITVKWESCNVTPNSIGIVLIKHDPSVAYAQNEGSNDYSGFSLGGFDPYTGTADDGTQQITLPTTLDPNLILGQHYFILVSGLGDATNIGSGYSPRDYSDKLFTITSLTSNNTQAIQSPIITNTGNCTNLTYSLKYKDKDINRKGEVTILQKFLKDKGYLNVSPTGYFGTLTLKAVKSFQKANGINQTGLVGSITRGKIKASCADSG